MHTFGARGESVVFYDAFGLSCLDLRTGKLMTDEALSGRWFSSNGGTVLAYDERTNTRGRRSVPEFARGRVADEYALESSWVAVLRDGKQAAFATEAGITLTSIATGKRAANAPLARGQKLKPFSLGPRLDPWKAHDTRTFVGVDDSFVVFTSSGTLFGGRLVRGAIVEPWSVRCGLPQGRVTAIPHRSGTFVAAWHPASGRSCCALIRDGAAQAREVETLSPATWSGEALVYQPAAGLVVREPLSGGAGERFRLPRDAHGPGELMAHGARVLFIPFDRARVIDLGSGEAFSRKLGNRLAALRHTFLEYERRFQALGRVGNLTIELNCLHKPAFGRGYAPGFGWDDGDLGFLRLAVSTWLVHSLHVEHQGRWSLGTFRPPLFIRPIDAVELQRDFEVLDRGAMDLICSVGFIATPFDRSKKKPMGEDAERVLLWAVIEQLSTRRRVELARYAPAWVKRKLTPRLFVDLLDPSSTRRGWSDAQFAVAWLVLDFFGAGAVTVFIDWLVARPSKGALENPDIITDAPRRMVRSFPQTRQPLEAAIAGARKTATRERVAYLDSLGANLS